MFIHANPLRLLSTVVALFLLVGFAAGQSQEPRSVRCVGFSPDGKLFAACGSRGTNDGQLAIWETETWKLKIHIRAKAGFPRFAFSPDNQMLALSRFASETHLIDLSSKKKVGELIGHSDYARCVAFSPDGTRIVTGSYDQTVKVWDRKTQELISSISGDFGKIYEVAVSPDGSQLAVADADKNKLRLFDMQKFKEIFTSGRMRSLVPHVSFSPNGKFVSVSSWGGYSRLYNSKTHALESEFQTNSADWSEFSVDGRMLAVAAWKNVYVYSFPDVNQKTVDRIKRLIKQFEDDDYKTRQRASKTLEKIGPAAKPFLLTAMESDNAEVRWRSRRLRDRLATAKGAKSLAMDGRPQCATFSPDGTFLLAGDKPGNLVMWNTSDWRVNRRFALPKID